MSSLLTLTREVSSLSSMSIRLLLHSNKHPLVFRQINLNSKVNLSSIRRNLFKINSVSSTYAPYYNLNNVSLRKFHSSSVVSYCSQKKDDSNSSSSSDGGDGSEESEPEPVLEPPPQYTPPHMGALTPMTVPEVWPILPVLAVSRNPVFPKFIKILEISDPSLVDLIRRKVKLNQPYAGVFMKKFESDSEVVEKLDDIYNIGTFVQIHELQDLGKSLRMVVMAYRRIKINKQVLDENNSHRRRRRKLHKVYNEIAGKSAEEAELSASNPVLMVEVENVSHEAYESTEEIKVKYIEEFEDKNTRVVN